MGIETHDAIDRVCIYLPGVSRCFVQLTYQFSKPLFLSVLHIERTANAKGVLILPHRVYINTERGITTAKQLSKMVNKVQNKGLIFKKVPSGWPIPGQDLAVEERLLCLRSRLTTP